MLYSIEVNEPYQAGMDYKFRCLTRLSTHPGALNAVEWCGANHDGVNEHALAHSDQERLQKLVALLDQSLDAAVVPLEPGEGTEVSDAELDEALNFARKRQNDARIAQREIRVRQATAVPAPTIVPAPPQAESVVETDKKVQPLPPKPGELY
jgi:hypothetical protein